jgi:hypothetical protein
MKYASEAIYRITAWLPWALADELEQVFGDLEKYVDHHGEVEVVYETTETDMRDKVVAWLEARK